MSPRGYDPSSHKARPSTVLPRRSCTRRPGHFLGALTMAVSVHARKGNSRPSACSPSRVCVHVGSQAHAPAAPSPPQRLLYPVPVFKARRPASRAVAAAVCHRATAVTDMAPCQVSHPHALHSHASVRLTYILEGPLPGCHPSVPGICHHIHPAAQHSPSPGPACCFGSPISRPTSRAHRLCWRPRCSKGRLLLPQD
jgi:hypothetical protein